MLNETKLAFIGSGTMAEAMIKVILDKKLIPPKQIIGSGPREERGQELRDRYGIETTTDNREAAQAAEIVVLSVKPQVLPTVLTELQGCILPKALVLSIVAGRTMATIAAGLKHAAIVRAMPNTPAQIGEGMTVWTATPDVNGRQQAQAQTILRAMGQEIYATDEKALDMATVQKRSLTSTTWVF